jgi:hypothetical protein
MYMRVLTTHPASISSKRYTADREKRGSRPIKKIARKIVEVHGNPGRMRR